jgi:integrase
VLDLEIKNAKPQKKPYRLSDGGGLYLVVAPSGGKLWRWSYEFNGKEKLLSYGPYPAVSLAQARQLHAEAQSLKRQGTDPASAKQAKKRQQEDSKRASSTPTIAEVVAEWFRTWSEHKSTRYTQTVQTRLQRDILPTIGALAVDQLDAKRLVAIVSGIQSTRGAEDIARRTLQKLKQVFRFAAAKGYIGSSPIENTRPSDFLPSHTVQNFARIDPEDLPRLLSDIELYQGAPITRLALKLITLTFVRTSSLIEAEWSEIDFHAKRWKIPKEHMKGHKSPHIVPLARQTLQVLRLLRSISGESKYLFPGQGAENPTMSNGTIRSALQRMGYKDIMTGHGFRGVASTILHECGHHHDYIETQMAHLKKDKVSGAHDYAKYLVPRRYMMQDWADFLDETLRSGAYKLIPPSNRIQREETVSRRSSRSKSSGVKRSAAARRALSKH